MIVEKPVREECKERYILTIDYSRAELMEYHLRISKSKGTKQ